jgi:ABC-2 type transport system permease protein
MLIFVFTLSIILMILIPIILAGLFRRRFQAPWILFAIGTLTFIASQVVHLPLNSLLTTLHVLPKNGLTDGSITLIQSCLVLGLTAGLCEETARLVGYLLLKRFRRLEDGIMLGLGHSGIEAMIFGGVLTAATVTALIPMIGTDLSKLNLSPVQLSGLTAQLNALTGNPLGAAAAPLFERLLAICIHVICSLMVLQAFRRHNYAWYGLAIVYHMAIDSGTVYAAQAFTNSDWHYPVMIGLLVPGLVWAILVWRKEPHPAAAAAPRTGVDLSIFWTSVRKELVQQWRTKRFLVVMSVFVLFGLTSPMAAKFTPEILKSVAGAEQFAGLIPTPTVADAMGQYVKNITQFGFILAVLLGMNAVAGEKESGTAAMVLSKPLPRWAFVLSKFTAQALVYLSAFMVAGLGAYYYTVVLFGGLDGGLFAGINLLLLVWLLVFVAAALLGSVIGSSIAMAAGVGLGICVAFLLAGSIPQYGALFPGGLIGWASTLGTSTAGTATQIAANGGALAGCLVLIGMCLVWSVALFERQEI